MSTRTASTATSTRIDILRPLGTSRVEAVAYDEDGTRTELGRFANARSAEAHAERWASRTDRQIVARLPR